MDGGRNVLNFLIGVGIGVGIGLLFAPQSGEETREWLTEQAEDQVRKVRRSGRRFLFEAQDVLARGEHTVNKMLRTSKSALHSVALKLE